MTQPENKFYSNNSKIITNKSGVSSDKLKEDQILKCLKIKLSKSYHDPKIIRVKNQDIIKNEEIIKNCQKPNINKIKEEKKLNEIIKRLYYKHTDKKFGFDVIKERCKLTEYVTLSFVKKKLLKIKLKKN